MSSCPIGFVCLDTKTSVIIITLTLVVSYFIFSNKKDHGSHTVIRSTLAERRIEEPLLPPERTTPSIVPINIPTRGDSTGYQQIGVLIEESDQDANKKILPLYGEQTYRGSRNWHYYTSTDGFHTMKLPVLHKNRNCQDSNGCEEIYDNDKIKIIGYEKLYKVTLYGTDSPRYIP